MITYEDAKAKLAVDQENLNENITEQATLFLEVSEKYVDALHERDKAKELLQEVDALVATQYRKEAEENGEKLTEARLSQKVQISEDHSRVFNNYLEKKLTADKWHILKEAYTQRCSLLKTCTELYIAGYFSIT